MYDNDNDHQETYVGSQYVARDSIEAADDPTAGPWGFGGVACAAGDILRTNDGKPVLLTAEELAQAEYAKPSKKLTVDHPEYDGGSPPVESIVGNNAMSYSSDGEAIVYDAETHDEDIAAGVHSDSFDVSIHAGFELGEQDPETGAYIARNIVFADLSVVGVGDSESNTVEWGGRQEVAAWAHGGGLEAALAEGDDDITADLSGMDDDDAKGLIRRLAERMGILPSDDRRGRLWFDDQTSDGETVTLAEASFDGASWMVSLHADGSEFSAVADGLGPALGVSETHDPGESAHDIEIPLADGLSEDQTLFAVLRYAADGEASDPITTSDGGHFVDSAFVGVAPDGVEIEADSTEQSRSGESGRGAGDSSATQNTMTDRDDNIEFITANSHFDDEVLADMDDEQVEQTRDLVDEDEEPGENEQDADNGTDNGSDNDGQQLGDMTVGELGDALQQQGFVTEDEMAEAAAEQGKSDMADEIIAASPDYADDDREELLASPESVVERIHKKETTIAAAPAPGVGGARSTAEASVGDTEEHDIDDFGTGVAE